MDVAIKEVGATLLVGLFTILTADALVVFLLGRRLIGFFNDRIGFDDHATTKAALLVAVSLAAGMLAEDISYKFVDDKDHPVVGTARAVGRTSDFIERNVRAVSRRARAVAVGSAPPDDVWTEHQAVSRRDFRFHALALHQELQGAGAARSQGAPGGGSIRVTPTWLGKDVGALGLFSRLRLDLGQLDGSRLDDWFRSGKPTRVSNQCVAALEHASERLYYQAKNVVFLKSTLFEEMTRIEMRLDFSRSMSLIAFSFLLLAQALFVGRVLELLLTRRANAAAAVEDVGIVVDTHRVDSPLWPYGVGIGLYSLAAAFGLPWVVLLASSTAGVVMIANAGGVLKLHRRYLYQACASIVLLTGFWGAGLTAYWREQEEFDKRAFGYYSTLAGSSDELQSVSASGGVQSTAELLGADVSPCPLETVAPIATLR